ncbi:HEPN domain-containing protein [Candidatus Endoriftia persephonae]|jgi:hypothetical protein|uniref:RiboL-PSP-HEPN domain-containing protein n=2 Tax=Gammaproteobacteria TaxID=1236 RepID=A0A9J6ZUR1_9GAMM|nr:HEPN domain-containing protein [Candidatus Endoriftia persephone]USF86391.1 hypothetical protein L0Y14_09560 [Candidatus Endoriftia persephone]
MASQSLTKFYRNISDVHKLAEAHSKLNPGGLGRRSLGHITRSGVVMLCAAWEVYFEDIVTEAVRHITGALDTPSQLPPSVQKKLSSQVKADSHELKPLELAGEGWKELLLHYARKEASSINTPKSHVLELYAKHFIGTDGISSAWHVGPDRVNHIVSIRGEIAHRGRDAEYIPILDLKLYTKEIVRTAVETDNHICLHIKSATGAKSQPWRRKTVPE